MKSAVVCALSFAALALAGKSSLPPRYRLPRSPLNGDPSISIHEEYHLSKRQVPAEATGLKTVKSPNGYSIRYKEQTDKGICELNKGVRSFSGYVDLSSVQHVFFMFFASRRSPAKDPLTLWLNGGPGSDSMIGLFEELGPCTVTEDLKPVNNPYSWNSISNMLFISQPVGVGFSYATEQEGSISDITGTFLNASVGGVDGRFSVIDQPTLVSTSHEAAVATWEVLQTVMQLLPEIDSSITVKDFNLWTESYGGHYGPAFSEYFYSQNVNIAAGKLKGIHFNFNSLGIINGIIDEVIQVPQYVHFATENTYGIQLINSTVVDYETFALNMPNGCLDQLALCRETNQTTPVEQAICAEAENMCRDNVEGPYYYLGDNRGVYDIRTVQGNDTPPEFWPEYLNLAHVQQALGVEINYTATASNDVYYHFQQSGDFVYNSFLNDLEALLDSGLRIELAYGDADYICNWFGGEQVSVVANWTHADAFRKAGYTPFLVSGTEYGETREYGKFSFTRVYESGHEIPGYQPKAALALFNRAINGLKTSTGQGPPTDSGSSGPASATHTNAPPPPLPSSTSADAPASQSAEPVIVKRRHVGL